MPRPGGWKTGNYWQNIDALAAARRTGCDDALLFNPAGMLVSASMANVFLRIDGTWTTPALETGARDGVVREWTLAMLDASESIHSPDALACCTSAFLTNSRMGIRTIAELDGRPLIDASAEIQQRYFDEVFST
jgi:branched-subunit amino acid aminotransferase/4-amino-4-deoxychorismate lyase